MREYLRKVMDERSLSLAALSEKLGYRSKTSLDRIMSANSRESSLRKFERAMLASFPMTAEEEAELHEAVRIAIYGEEKVRVGEKMMEFVCGTGEASNSALEIVDVDSGACVDLQTRYADAAQLQVTVLNCQYVLPLFALLREQLARDSVTVNHYMLVNGDNVRTVSAMNAVMSIFFMNGYSSFARTCAPGEEICGSNEADVAAFTCRDADGREHTDVILFTGAHSGRMISRSGAGAFLKLLGLDDARYRSIKLTYFDAAAFEDYVRYSSEYAALERNRSVWKIKPDLSVDQIPVSITEAALLRGCAPQSQDEAFWDTLTALRDIYRMRVENTFSKKKHAYTIYKRGALRRFARTGRTKDHFWMMAPYTVQERIAILKEQLNQMTHNPYVHMYLLNDDDAIRDVEIAYYEDKGMLFLDANTDYRLDDGHSEVLIIHPEMLRLYREFFTDMLLRESVCTETETAAFFRELIEMCKNELNASQSEAPQA